ADAIERLAEVDTVVLDKTGTLTLPEPELVNAQEIPPAVLSLAGRLALTSRHPLAAALARAAGAKIPLEGAVEEPGHGVRAIHEGIELRLGRPEFCGTDAHAGNDPEASAIAFRQGDAQHTFVVRQRLRDDAADVVAALQRDGFAVEI